MKIHIMENDGKKFQFWYDCKCRCWFAARVDENGDICKTIDAYSREEIVILIKKGYAS